MDFEALELVVEGQGLRNILDKSISCYLSKCKVMTELLNKNNVIRARALLIDEQGNALKHTGLASRVFKLRLPMEVETAKLLFAMLSIDTSLPKRKRPEMGVTLSATHITDPRNPAADQVTVSAQTYQNYKSALKWWHEYDSAEMDKTSEPWSAELDTCIRQRIASYKRDIGTKKRKGIMKNREGKSAYNLNGYMAICKHLWQMKPEGHR